jgi:hypothetical protein
MCRTGPESLFDGYLITEARMRASVAIHTSRHMSYLKYMCSRGIICSVNPI